MGKSRGRSEEADLTIPAHDANRTPAPVSAWHRCCMVAD